jgi:ABC-type uncharacterized transport system permease subunit
VSLIEFGLIICFIGFLLSSLLCAKALYTKRENNHQLTLLVSVISTAVQLFLAKQVFFLNGDAHFSLAAMMLLISSLINLAILIKSAKQINPMMLLVTMGFSTLVAALLLITPIDSNLYQAGMATGSLPMAIHIILSVSAYCVLVIASLYALQFHYIDLKLKSKTLSLNSFLPPLSVVERQHFNLMSFGVILLTAALTTGFTFLDSMWSVDYAHKTALSIIAWAMFVVLTLGHKIYGWRGNGSVVATIIAAALLTLAYFGSRFVKEVLLS